MLVLMAGLNKVQTSLNIFDRTRFSWIHNACHSFSIAHNVFALDWLSHRLIFMLSKTTYFDMTFAIILLLVFSSFPHKVNCTKKLPNRGALRKRGRASMVAPSFWCESSLSSRGCFFPFYESKCSKTNNKLIKKK